jgi:hypothetical protein
MKLIAHIVFTSATLMSINCVAAEIKLTDEEQITFAKVCRAAYEAAVGYPVKQFESNYSYYPSKHVEFASWLSKEFTTKIKLNRKYQTGSDDGWENTISNVSKVVSVHCLTESHNRNQKPTVTALIDESDYSIYIQAIYNCSKAEDYWGSNLSDKCGRYDFITRSFENDYFPIWVNLHPDFINWREERQYSTNRLKYDIPGFPIELHTNSKQLLKFHDSVHDGLK